MLSFLLNVWKCLSNGLWKIVSVQTQVVTGKHRKVMNEAWREQVGEMCQVLPQAVFLQDVSETSFTQDGLTHRDNTVTHSFVAEGTR